METNICSIQQTRRDLLEQMFGFGETQIRIFINMNFYNSLQFAFVMFILMTHVNF